MNLRRRDRSASGDDSPVIEIAKSVIGDPSTDPADRVAALTWLETHGKG